MRYTDVDRLLLERWTEVVALREAFDDLLERMGDSVQAAIVKAERWAADQGWETDRDLKQPSVEFWKPDWTRKRNEPVLQFRIADFAPREYGNKSNPHPWVWLITEELGRLRLNDADRTRFARELRIALGSNASKWDHPDVDDTTEPIGHYFPDISEADRVRWMSQPDDLAAFLTGAMSDAMTIAPAIDETLAKYRRT